jgi:hypothetical protein
MIVQKKSFEDGVGQSIGNVNFGGLRHNGRRCYLCFEKRLNVTCRHNTVACCRNPVILKGLPHLVSLVTLASCSVQAGGNRAKLESDRQVGCSLQSLTI